MQSSSWTAVLRLIRNGRLPPVPHLDTPMHDGDEVGGGPDDHHEDLEFAGDLLQLHGLEEVDCGDWSQADKAIISAGNMQLVVMQGSDVLERWFLSELKNPWMMDRFVTRQVFCYLRQSPLFCHLHSRYTTALTTLLSAGVLSSSTKPRDWMEQVMKEADISIHVMPCDADDQPDFPERTWVAGNVHLSVTTNIFAPDMAQPV